MVPALVVSGEIVLEDREGVCLAEEAERLRRSGLSVGEVSRRMGVDVAWVESVTAPHEESGEPETVEG